MEETAILSATGKTARMHTRRAEAVPRVMLFCSLLLACVSHARGDMDLAGLAGLSDADRFRQLNLILMVSDGADAAFLDALLPGRDSEKPAPSESLPRLDIDDFQTPLNRIVDQREMITRAARVFRFALENRANVMLALKEISASDPAEVAQVDLIRLAEDAIIVRTALAGSIEYLVNDGDPALATGLATYQNGTVYLRNVMEYWKFDRELAAITGDAMADTGGRMEAYQRMLEDEPNFLGFKQHLQAVEEIYKNTQPRKVDKKDLESKELINEESQVKQPE